MSRAVRLFFGLCRIAVYKRGRNMNINLCDSIKSMLKTGEAYAVSRSELTEKRRRG